MRHVPYQRFKNKPHDTESSPVIKIDFELLQTNSIIEQCLAEMKETCVANTLPPSTNERPPWNPVYENLYIMEVQSVSLILITLLKVIIIHHTVDKIC